MTTSTAETSRGTQRKASSTTSNVRRGQTARGMEGRLAVRDGQLQVVHVERGTEPFSGHMALPGGFVKVKESLAAAAYRDLKHETGISKRDVLLEQVATYGAPDRDPADASSPSRGWRSVPTFPTLEAARKLPTRCGCPSIECCGAGKDWPSTTPQILRDGVERARAKLEYSPLATAFCGP